MALSKLATRLRGLIGDPSHDAGRLHDTVAGMEDCPCESPQRTGKVAAVDRTTQGLAELAQAVQERQQGANLMTIEADLARDEAIDEIVSKARGRFGVIDILVNNAGVGQATIRSDNRQHPIKFWEVTQEQWKLFVAVHTSAPMALSRALVHDMMRQKWGRIVNVTTSLGTMIRDGAPTYGPSKAALEAFSAIMAKDRAGTSVTVNMLGR